MKGLEAAHGRALTEWARAHPDARVRVLFHIPNGGGRSKATAGMLKAEGVLAGVWDYHLPVVTPKYPGLWIELKAPQYRNHKQGGLSKEQIDFGRHLRGQGYALAVHYDWTDAMLTIEGYLAGRPISSWVGG